MECCLRFSVLFIYENGVFLGIYSALSSSAFMLFVDTVFCNALHRAGFTRPQESAEQEIWSQNMQLV